MSAILAIDPGQAGGAVLLPDGDRLTWWGWRKMRRKSGDVYRVSARDWSEDVDSLAVIGHSISRTVYDEGWVFTLVVESLFAARKNGAIAMGEACGLLMAEASTIADTVHRPYASTWRCILGLDHRATSSQAKAAAVAYAVDRWPELEDVPEKVREHVCEAACMAAWAEEYADG